MFSQAYFILFLLGHVIADFYIQTNNMADKKEKSFKWLVLHCLCYELLFLLLSIPVFSYKLLIALIIAGICHFIIDLLKYIILKRIRCKKQFTDITDRNAFFIDQLLHIISLLVIVYWFRDMEIAVSDKLTDIIYTFKIPENIFMWLLALLLVHKPANIMIQKLLIKYKPEKKEKQNRDKNAGRLIGSVERVIMLILIALGQYSAIGLVLTAKSIARYDRIAKEEDFAEYYLLGTLLSTLFVIVISFIVK